MCGRNSLPRCETIGRQEIAASAAVTSVIAGRASDEVHERPVSAHERGGQRVAQLRDDAAPEQPIAQRRGERQRDERARQHHQRLAERQRPQQAPGLAAEREHRHERQRGDEQRRQDRRDERSGRGDETASVGPPAPPPDSRRRWQASSATRSASTAMPSAMAIPPRLMTVTGTPNSLSAANVRSTMSGSVHHRDQRARRVQQEQEDHEGDDRRPPRSRRGRGCARPGPPARNDRRARGSFAPLGR